MEEITKNLNELSIPKVKLFRFRVSNNTSIAFNGDKGTKWYIQDAKELHSEIVIENVINRFLLDKELISLNVSTVDVGYHNNARGNTIDLIYTITYKNKENN